MHTGDNGMNTFTVGMAHFRDFSGAYFTIQNIRINLTPEQRRHVEYVIIDNSPGSDDSRALAGFVESVNLAGESARLIPMESPVGTSPSRERIFEEAYGEFVVVVDCHVLLLPGAFDRLITFYAKHASTRDIHSGPLIWDTLENGSTHLNPGFRDLMYGKWAAAWACICGTHFTVDEDDGAVVYRSLDVTCQDLRGNCPQCHTPFPKVPFAGHETSLRDNGFQELLHSEIPFDIPGQGCGLFSCRRDAWAHFNPHCREFGGEEIWIHQKFVKRGNRSLCLPWLKWIHRFGHVGGVQYPIRNWQRVRNYVLEWNEIGWDLEAIHQHFIVEKSAMPQRVWEQLVQDPIHVKLDATVQQKSSSSRCFPQPPEGATLEEMFRFVDNLNFHQSETLHKLRELARQCESVIEYSNCRETTIAILNGRPKSFRSFNESTDMLLRSLRRHAIDEIDSGNMRTCEIQDGSTITTTWESAQLDQTDLLLLNLAVTGDKLMAFVRGNERQVRKWIAICLKGLDMTVQCDAQQLQSQLNDWLNSHSNWRQVTSVNARSNLILLARDDNGLFKSPAGCHNTA